MSTGYVSHYDAERARLRVTFESERKELERVLRDVRIFHDAHGDTPIAVPDSLPEPTGAATNEQLRDRIAHCRSTRERLQNEVADARVRLDLAGMREALRVGDRSTARVRSAAEVLAEAEATSSGTPDRRPSAVGEEDVQRVLGRLDRDVPERERDEVLAFAAALLERPDDPRAPRWLDGLRDRVRSASRAAAAQRESRTHARTVLADLDDHAPYALVHALDAVARGRRRLDPDLRARADEAVSDARARADARLVAETLSDVLEELGYDVHRSPEPAGAAGVFGRPGWGPYVVSATVDETEHLQLGLVRTDATADDPVRDREMEHEWCSQIAQLEESLGDAGVSLSTPRRFELADTPMPVNEDLAVSAPRRRRRPRAARRAR